MHSSNIRIRYWAIVLYMATTNLKGISSMKVHRELGITQKSAWYMMQRIREGFDLGDKLLSLTRSKWMKLTSAARRRTSITNKKASTPVAGDRGKNTGRLVPRIVTTNQVSVPPSSKEPHRKDLEGFIQDRVEPGSTVYTDDHGGYNRLWLDFEHSFRPSQRQGICEGSGPHQRD